MTKLFVSTTFLICVWSTIALGFSTNAKTALVIDNTTGEVLLSKDTVSYTHLTLPTSPHV